MAGIPTATSGDSEDVVWALQTADALWERKERSDAIIWLRRAAEAAGEANDDDRALVLARRAAELTDWIAANATNHDDAVVDEADLDDGDVDDVVYDVDGDSVDVMIDGGSLLPSFPLEGDPDAAVDEPGLDAVHADDAPAVSLAGDLLEDDDAVTNPPPAMPSVQPRPRAPGGPPPLPSRASASTVDAGELTHGGAAAGDGARPRVARKPNRDTSPPSARPSNLGQTVPKPVARKSEPPKRSSKSAFPKPGVGRVDSSGKRQSTIPRRASGFPRNDSHTAPPAALSNTDESPMVEVAAAHELVAEVRLPSFSVAPSAPPEPPPDRVRVDAPMASGVPSVGVAEIDVADVALAGDDSYQSETEEHAVTLPPARGAASSRPQETDDADEVGTDDAPREEYEAPQRSAAWPSRAPEPIAVSGPVDDDAIEAPLDLATFEAFADLPDEARDEFALAAQDEVFAEGEEISGFALALVVHGHADVSATIVDASAARLETGAVLRSLGTIDAHVPMRIVTTSKKARIATWPKEAVEAAFASCPWVEDDLRAASDRVQTLVGATMGAFGERLDATLRGIVTDKLSVKSLAPGEVLVAQGKPVPGFVVVGVGVLELQNEKGTTELGSGEFLFVDAVLGAAPAPATARAGAQGALILFGNRMVAQELLVTCPPLLEIFAGG